jgi:hypothetical protein
MKPVVEFDQAAIVGRPVRARDATNEKGGLRRLVELSRIARDALASADHCGRCIETADSKRDGADDRENHDIAPHQLPSGTFKPKHVPLHCRRRNIGSFRGVAKLAVAA